MPKIVKETMKLFMTAKCIEHKNSVNT